MWTMLTFAKSPGTKPGDIPSNRFTRPRDPCESALVIDTPSGTYACGASWGWIPSEKDPVAGKYEELIMIAHMK